MTRAAPTFTPTPEPGDEYTESHRIPYATFDRLLAQETFEGGHRVTAVLDAKGNPLRFTVVRTMMREQQKQPESPKNP